MSIDPFTGEYTSPFASGGAVQGLPQFKPLPFANPPGTMLGRAFGRGVDILQQNIGSAVEGIGGSLGLQGVEAFGSDVVARNAAEVARSAALERPDGGLTGYLAGLVGENAPQMGVSVALPAVGSVFGPAGTALGVGASALINYLTLAGENRERQRQVSPGQDINEAAAFGAAVPGAALETLSGALGARLATGALRRGTADQFFSRQTAANAARAAGVGALAEAPTEIGQQFLTRAQAGQALADREAFGEYFDAGVGAAILGGMLGGGSSAVGDFAAVRAKNAAAATNDELKSSVDQSLQLGPTPPLASKLNALANPEAMMGPLGGVEAPLDRPFARATDADLLADLTATEQRLAAGGATQDDARNLRMLRAELAAREAQVAPPPLPEVDPQLQMFGRGLDARVARQEAQLAALRARVATPTLPEDDSSFSRLASRAAQRAQRQVESDAADLEANRDQARDLRAEELRQTIARMNAEDEQRSSPLARQETKSLRAALKALDDKAKQEPLDTTDQTLQRVLRTELSARDPSPEDRQALQAESERQGFLFEEMSPQAERARGQAAAEVAATKKLAAQKGLSANSKFYKALDARTEEELIDRVLDNATNEKDPKGTLGKIAFAVGVDRDLNAEIAEAQAKVEEFGGGDVRTEKGRKAFLEAQRKVAELREVKAKYDAAVARKRLRDTTEGTQMELPFRQAQMAEQQAPVREGVPAGQAQPLTAQNIPDTISRLTVQQEGQPSLFAAREMPAQAAPQAQVELPGLRNLPEQQAPVREGVPVGQAQPLTGPDIPDTISRLTVQPQEQLPLAPGRPGEPVVDRTPPAPVGTLGESLREAGLVTAREADAAARKDQQFLQAIGQRLEQQSPEAEAQRAAVEAEPDRIVSEELKGTEATITFARSAPIKLEYRKGAWYSAGRFLARKLADAKKVAIAQRSGGSPLFRAARHEADDIAQMTGADRLREVQDVIAKATRTWPGRGQANVVQNFDAMPEAAKMMFTNPDVAREAAGVAMGDGTVYIFADNIASRAEAVSVLYHEVLGHRGFRAAFQRDRKKLLTDFYNSNQTVRDLVQAWKDSLGPETFERFYGDLSLDLHVEEALAYLSEKTGPIQSTLLKRMKALIMRYASRFGWKRNFTDREVMVMVAEAHRRAMADAVRPQPTVTRTAARTPAQRGPVATAQEVQAAANTYGDTVTSTAMLRAAAAATSGTPDTTEGYQKVVGRLMKIANIGERKLGSMTLSDMRENFRDFGLQFQSRGHLAEQYGRLFPMIGRRGLRSNAIEQVGQADALRTTISQVMSRLANRIPEQADTLSDSLREDFYTLMSSTFSQLDPFKRLEDHAHLTPAQQVERRDEYARIVAARDRLGKAGKLSIYREARAMNDATYFQQLALDLYDRITQNPDVTLLVPAAKENPALRFLDDTSAHADPEAFRKFWEGELTTLTAQAANAVKALGRRPATANEAQRINTIASGIQSQLEVNGRNLNALKQYPYFHLGRFGRYYATFKMPRVRTADGRMVADPRAVEAVAEALHKIGMDNVVVTETTEAATVFIRMDRKSEAERVTNLALELQKTGSVDPETRPDFGEVEPMQVLPEQANKVLNSLIDEFTAANAPLDSDDLQTRADKEAYVQKAVADFRRAYLARLPEASASKVMARRGFKAGFDRDMTRAFSQRLQIAANSTGTRIANEIKGRATRSMIDQIKQTGPQNPNKWAMISVLREIMKREAGRADSAPNGFVDTMVAINHNWFLAMNPGYWLTQIAQMGTNVWPELVKGGVSYKRAFEAISGTFPTAFTLVQAAIRTANEQGFLKYGADATVTTEVLEGVTLSRDPARDAELKQVALRMFMRGIIDIGSPSRELGRVVEARDDTVMDTTMRWASSGSFYLEMMTRLNTALAAYEIAKEKGMNLDEAVEYSAKVVQQAMMDYTEPNRARALSRQGPAGQFTPLGTAFLTFQFQMLEKYSREIGTAFINGAATPAEKKAARRWLGSHLTMMTALAGGLGLPFVTVVARVIEGMVDLLDDDEEPYNAKVAMRNLASDMFGADVAEVLMRGIPRAVGFDISGRVGAADIMPFSRLMADRREWEEAIKELTYNTAGAPLSMVTQMLDGMDKIADGQFFEGAKAMLPVALKNPLEAYKIGTTGVTDSNGNLLPIEPQTMTIIWQAMGLTPQERAEYSEANFAQAVRRSVGIREATEIRKKIIRAVQAGDRQAALDAIAEARAFDAASPGFAILPSISSSIGQAQRRMATAQATGAELGVRPADTDALALTRFANY